MTIRHYIFFVLLLSGFFVSAQKLNLQKFSIKEGLVQSTVKHIEQDNYGNLWLATSNGLSKFNGRSFENFTTTNGLPANEVSALLFANDYLFIGTKKGFCVYNGSNIYSTKACRQVTGTVKKILQQKNNLHVITSKGYYIVDITSFPFKTDSVAIPNIISQGPSDAEFDENGNLWISTINKGLFFIQNTISTKIPKFVLVQNSASSTVINNKLVRVANFNSGNLLRGDAIYCIEFDKRNNLLISDWNNGIAVINFDLISGSGFAANYISPDSLSINSIAMHRFVNIQKDTEGNLYLATDGFGFIKIPIDYNTNENDYAAYTAYTTEMGFYGNNPLCFKQDSYQNIWIGTLYDGLILMNNKNSLSYNQKTGLEEEKVVSVYGAADSSIWCGTYGGGAFRYKKGKFKRAFWEQGISESIIKTITEDHNGNIFLGTYGGGISVITKDNTTKSLNVSRVISEPQGLTGVYVSFLYTAKNGAVWIGYQGEDHIDRLVLNKDLSFSITSFPINNTQKFSVTCITEDDEENIWITSNDGVWFLNSKTGYVNNEYSVFKNVQTICKDWNGNMWIGTTDIGTLILKNKLKARYFENGNANAFEKVTTENGISSNCINSILITKDAVWLISNNGLNEIKIDTYLSRIKEIKSYNKGNGFASYDNKPNTSVFDHEGIIWIGSVEGLTQYRNLVESQDALSQKNLVVYINALNVENKPVNWSDSLLFSSGELESVKFNGFFNWYHVPKDLELDYTHNSVQFFLNTNNIADQKLINYSYKLIGYDKNWINLYNSNEIAYRNLPSGDYSLIIKASLSNDFSTSQEFTYHFSIKPPFWKSTSFYVLSIIGLLALLYYYIIQREKRLKREKLKLELQVKSRTYEIENQKKEIELQSGLIRDINKDLTDSIKYAERIQKTILPNTSILTKYFTDHFIYYKPRNIVSGDYYWIKEINNQMYVAVVDCTGHGVPGAFMSLITSSILNESVNVVEQLSPAKMLEFLRRELYIRVSTNQSDQINDGLDIALICYDKTKQTLEYVNANRPLYIISDNQLITLASENVHIGGFADLGSVIPTKTISVKKDDLLFLFTDGITDQFGGERNKKYNPARLRQFLLMNDHLPLTKLQEKLRLEISQWQGSYEQTDDILLIGLKL